MSHNSDDRNVSNFAYIQQNSLSTDEEEETATLAEPMTLEGAKQLAQTTPTPPTLTPPLSNPIHGTGSPSPIASPTSPLSLHHHLSSPLPIHSLPSARTIINSSPSPGIGHSTIHTSITHQLSSPPHLVTHNHHSHSLWPPSTRPDEITAQDETELASTVDIQAIRDTPSPDLSTGKLTTINENWDSLEDQQETSFEDQMEIEDSADEDDSSDSSDTDSKLSDSESNHSHVSSRSESVLKIKSCSNNSRSGYESDINSVGSKSESGDSQDSESESSDCSSTDEESHSSSDDEEDRTLLEEHLPRRKPQLTASNLKLPETFSSSGHIAAAVVAKSKLSDIKSIMCHQNLNDCKVKILANKIKENLNYEKALLLKKSTDSSKAGPDPYIKPKKSGATYQCRKVFLKEEKYNEASIDNSFIRHQEKSDTPMERHSKVNVPNSMKMQNHALVSDINIKTEITHSESKAIAACNKSLKKQDKIPSAIYNWKLEKRRLKKKQEMELEFDRLLKSNKQLNFGDEAAEVPVRRKSAKETYLLTEKENTLSDNNNKKLVRSKEKKVCNEVLIPNPRSVSSLSIFDSKSESSSDVDRRTEASDTVSLKVPLKSDQSKERKYKFSKEVFRDVNSKLVTSKLCEATENYYQRNKRLLSAESKSDFSSDAKSIELSSTSSSESEDILPASNCKRTPSLNVTAKVIAAYAQNKTVFKNSSLKHKSGKITTCSENLNIGLSPIKKFEGSLIRPTIADVVKVRERRKSFDGEGSLSGGERRSSGDQSSNHSCNASKEDEDETSSSETFEDLNEKIDVDTEHTQTFSVSESNFNQGRLTMRIAAMKMAKFGKTGLKEAMTGGIPTRSDLHNSSLFHLSPNRGFKRPKIISHSKSALKREVPKVKTAAERKTYVDALPPSASLCLTTRGRKNKLSGSRIDMRVPAASLYRSSGSCGHGSMLGYHHSANLHTHGPRQPTDVDDEISRIAQTLSQISHDQLGSELHEQLSNGLQVLDQDDLAAILPDVSYISPQPDTPSLDPFRDEFPRTNNSVSEEDLSSSNETSPEEENLLSMVILPEEENINQLNHSFEETLDTGMCPTRSFQTTRRLTKRTDRSCKSKDDLVYVDRRKRNNRRTCYVKDTDDGIPELESYVPLDCNISNVSPDSGIQSVSGSPLHAVGSPTQHPTPFYSVGASERPARPFSPSDSPPPPILVPAVTPPHLATSPHYNYEAPSPPMPSLMCQVDPPPWQSEHCDVPVKEVHETGDSGGSEEVETKEEKIKRPRGRPKGSKNRKKCSAFKSFIPRERKLTQSFIREPINSLAKLNQLTENKELRAIPDYSAMKHKWRGSMLDMDELPLKPIKRGPGRPKKIPTKVDQSKTCSVGSKPRGRPKLVKDKKPVEKEKKPVGRPRKHPKLETTDSTVTPQSINLSSRKCFSERIMHKIINEKIRNSEKSDKLSVRDDISCVEGNEVIPEKETKRRRLKKTSDGIPLEDRKRKRGRKKGYRKKELPKIFEKVYGNIRNILLKSEVKAECGKVLCSAIAKRKKKKHKIKFKSKHKNIVDPVFLAEVEKLSTELQKCFISKLLSFPCNKSFDAPTPAIFRIHTALFNIKKRKMEKTRTSDKESGTEADKDKFSNKRKKKMQEAPKRERSEANEQRLPLKKRHRHISTAVPTPPDPPKCENTKPDCVKSPSEKDRLNRYEELKADIYKDKLISKEKLPVTKADFLKQVKTEISKTVKVIEHKAKNISTPEIQKIKDIEISAFNEQQASNISDKDKDSCLLMRKESEAKSDKSVLKVDVPTQSMTATTPKKRHRLEAEIKASSSNVVSCNISQIASGELLCDDETTIKPASLNVKQENENKVKEKEASENISPNETSLDKPDKRILDSDTKICSSEEEAPKSNDLQLTCATQEESVKYSETEVCLSTLDEGTHSDSDIPSEHEPLYESDQSGFMSDKEGPKELPKKPLQKKRKRKKDLISTKRMTQHNNDFATKRKVKRRRTNKTGFPTIRRKKKKLIFAEQGELDNEKELPLIEPDSQKKKHAEDKEILPRPRGRPKKNQCSGSVQVSKEICQKKRNYNKEDSKKSEATEAELQNLTNILEKVANGVGHRTRNKRDLSEESNKTTLLPIKRNKKIIDDEIYDSDSNVVLSECQVSSEPASSDESSRSLIVRKRIPRWRKKYLVAGLLSDYYKHDEPPRRNGDSTMNKMRMLSCTHEDYPHNLLPPPSYCRKLLRETQVDFSLPYDLWWLHTHNMLPGRDLVPSWNYKRIKSNVYYDVKPNHDFDIQACNCKRPSKTDEKGCGDDCINRMMFIECVSQVCHISDVCSNQRIQKHESRSHLQRFMTTHKGWGVKTTDNLTPGTFIMEYVGEVVSEKEFKHRMQTRYSNDKHHYCLNLNRGMVIDGHRMGGDCRFVNHSCDPNCEMQKWCVNGQYRMALFALKDIDKSQELTYDYNFSLFNPTEGQICKCCSENCRGVIGGRSQRLNGWEEKKKSSGRNKKEMRRKRGLSTDTESTCLQRPQLIPIKPLSHQQKLFILAHRCFLLRNLKKVRRSRDKINNNLEAKKPDILPATVEEPENKIEKFLTHFTALNTARSVKTRRLVRAEDDPQMTRVAKLAQIFKDIYDKLVASRDAKEKPLATPFMNLPSKKKHPTYYTRVGEPIDLTLVEKNILTGYYTSADVFDQDIMRLFANNLRFYGRNTEIGHMAVGLRRVYSECKLQFKPFLEEVIGEDQLPQAFVDCAALEDLEDEDVIRCVCNLHRDEGMMIQCERCLVWQHCDCMGVAETASPDHYLCEECSPRIVCPEVPMIPQPTDSPNDHKYFITILRDNLQIKQGDSVYILRDRPSQKAAERRQPAYKLAKDIKSHELLIFKVENLWIDEKGDKFAFGHHYLKPHETFHEPWRKFFPNEVIRSPHCEILPLDMIVNHCWVLDLNTYCRGRPIVAAEDHVYVCEYRVDKIARVFSKISKPKYPICTKPYAFISFPTRLKPQRTYTPHEVSSNGRCKKAKEMMSSAQMKEEDPDSVTLALSTSCGGSSRMSRSSGRSHDRATSGSSSPAVATQEIPSIRVKEEPSIAQLQREKQRVHVNQVTKKLLHRMPTKGIVDLSFLLEHNGKRQRKKTAAFSS